VKFSLKEGSRQTAFRALWIAVGLGLACEVVALLWRPQADDSIVPPHLRLDLTEVQAAAKDLELIEIQERQVGGLTYTRGQALRVEVDKEKSLEALYLEYDSGNPATRDELTGHPPHVCLSNSGVRVTEVYPTEWLNHQGEEIRLQFVRSKTLGKNVYIFKVIWIPEWHGNTQYEYSQNSRLLRAFLGMPKPPGSMLMVGVHGADGLTEAKELFESYGLQLLKLQDKPATVARTP